MLLDMDWCRASFHVVRSTPEDVVRWNMAAEFLSPDLALLALRAVAEPTRLRIIALLAAGELTVKDLTRILGQSQPRISRHLKLLHDAGLLTRAQEVSWVYFRLTDEAARATLLEAILSRIDNTDGDLERDRQRAAELRRERFEHAQAFFASNAAEWDRLRALHIDEAEVERRLLDVMPEEPCDLLVDMGTGTGRMLEVLAGRYRRAIGVDTNQHMLAYARTRTEVARFRNVQIRQGDICSLALGGDSVGTVVMHQVLHFLAEPERAIAEAARILKPGGLLVIADFAPHEMERLRDEYAHQRLGFSNEQMTAWFRKAGLRCEHHDQLPPGGDGDSGGGLTVSIWLARRPETNEPAAARNKVLETI